MRPIQLSRQLRDNLFLMKKICKLHHSANAFFVKTFLSIVLLQLSRNLRDNLFTILSTLISKHFTINTLANMPIHHGLGIVGRSSHMATCFLNNLTQILYQGLCRSLRDNLVVLLYLVHFSFSVFIKRLCFKFLPKLRVSESHNARFNGQA